MMHINPLRYYTVTDLMKMYDEGLFPIGFRQNIGEEIKAGRLIAGNFTKGEKPYWKIKGEHILQYLEEYGDTKEIQNVKPKRRKKKTKNEKSIPETKV